MRKYNRIMLGRGSKFASMCREEGYIYAGFEMHLDPKDEMTKTKY